MQHYCTEKKQSIFSQIDHSLNFTLFVNESILVNIYYNGIGGDTFKKLPSQHCHCKWIFFMCSVMLLLYLKVRSQRLQVNICPRCWVSRWVLRLLLRPNFFPHSGQEYTSAAPECCSFLCSGQPKLFLNGNTKIK